MDTSMCGDKKLDNDSYDEYDSIDDIDDSDDSAISVEIYSIYMAYIHMLAGLAMCLGIKYAGSHDKNCFNILYKLLNWCYGLRLNFIEVNNEFGFDRFTIETVLAVFTLSIGILMSGSGDLQTFKLLRQIRMDLDPHVTYGHHMAYSMAIGFLFLGGGKYTFGTSKLAIASLIISCYPRFPVHPLDNQFHLQALRHLYVLAIEKRHVTPIDVDTNTPCKVPLEVEVKLTKKERQKAIQKLKQTQRQNNHQIHFMLNNYKNRSRNNNIVGSSINNKTKQINFVAPCLLPDLRKIVSIKVNSSEFWPVKLNNLQFDAKQWETIVRYGIIYVKRKNESRFVVNNGMLGANEPFVPRVYHIPKFIQSNNSINATNDDWKNSRGRDKNVFKALTQGNTQPTSPMVSITDVRSQVLPEIMSCTQFELNNNHNNNNNNNSIIVNEIGFGNYNSNKSIGYHGGKLSNISISNCRVNSDFVKSLSNDDNVLTFFYQFCDSGISSDSRNELSRFCTLILQECLTQSKSEMITQYLEMFKHIQHLSSFSKRNNNEMMIENNNCAIQGFIKFLFNFRLIESFYKSKIMSLMMQDKYEQSIEKINDNNNIHNNNNNNNNDNYHKKWMPLISREFIDGIELRLQDFYRYMYIDDKGGVKGQIVCDYIQHGFNTDMLVASSGINENNSNSNNNNNNRNDFGILSSFLVFTQMHNWFILHNSLKSMPQNLIMKRRHKRNTNFNEKLMLPLLKISFETQLSRLQNILIQENVNQGDISMISANEHDNTNNNNNNNNNNGNNRISMNDGMEIDYNMDNTTPSTAPPSSRRISSHVTTPYTPHSGLYHDQFDSSNDNNNNNNSNNKFAMQLKPTSFGLQMICNIVSKYGLNISNQCNGNSDDNDNNDDDDYLHESIVRTMGKSNE